MHNLHQELRDFIISNFMFGEGNGLTNSDSFINKGIIDSTGVLELVLHIEETYRIEVGNHELIPENLDSIDNLVSYISKKLAHSVDERLLSSDQELLQPQLQGE